MTRDYLEDIRYTYRLRPRQVWLILDSCMDKVEKALGEDENEKITELRGALDTWYYEETKAPTPPTQKLFTTGADPGDEDDSGYGHGV